MKTMVLLVLGLVAACVPQSELAEPSSVRQSVLAESSSIPQESSMNIETVALPNLGPAPELQNEIWLNTDHPLRLAELRGKVVLIEMWTFG